METLLKKVYNSRRLCLSLKTISHLSVLITVAVYVFMLIHTYMEEPLLAVKLAVSGGIPYVIVTLFRMLINAPRPYELYEFYERKPKSKLGQSFPSRHVFSAFTVATLAFVVSAWLALAVFMLGICIAVSRVLLGMHFLRDVIAGAFIGLLSGALGAIIILF